MTLEPVINSLTSESLSVATSKMRRMRRVGLGIMKTDAESSKSKIVTSSFLASCVYIMHSNLSWRLRRVDMSDQLIDALHKLLTKCKKEALKEGRGEPIEIMFHKNGKYISQNTIRNIFKRILKKAKVRDMRLPDIRHTFASLLLTNGESLAYVKEQLGHSSIEITVDIYGHLIPGSNREALNRLDSQQTAKIERP